MTRILITACALGLLLPACGKKHNATNSDPLKEPIVAAEPAGDPGKSLDNFDPCSVVSDRDLVQALLAEAGDPSAMGTLTPSHAPADGTATGLPGAKACKQTWTTTDSAGRVSQGGDPVIVTFDKYINLHEIAGAHPEMMNDYQVSGAEAFLAPGDGGDPHLTKNGYLFRMSGNSDLKLLKAVALGIAKRL